MRVGVRDVLPVPIEREALVEAVARAQQRLPAAPARRRGVLYAFVGCKGGSGATFLASNLAHAIAAESGRKVALLDLNFACGDAALHVTQRRPTCTLAEVAQQVRRLDGELLASSMLQISPGFHVLAAPDAPERTEEISAESIDRLLEVAAGRYDVVVVDAGRTLDERSLRALDRAERIMPVLQLSVPSLHGAKRLLGMLGALGYGKDKIRLLVNRYDKAGPITLGDAAGTLRQEPWRAIPNSYRAAADAVNQGVPLLELAPRDPIARALREIAAELLELKKSSGGWLRSVLPSLL